jgi:hypothetical protein
LRCETAILGILSEQTEFDSHPSVTFIYAAHQIVLVMNDRAASRAESKIATPKNDAASCGVFNIPRKRDKENLIINVIAMARLF